MEDQHIDLLRVGQLALRFVDRDWPRNRTHNRFAAGLEEMVSSTGLPIATCQEVMETLAKQASQEGYERNLAAIRQAVGEARHGR
jgi:hypothetical protein